MHLGSLERGTMLATLLVTLAAMFLLADPAWAQAELTVDKTGSPGTVVEGEEITYTISVGNTGPDPARTVVVTDDVPAGAAFVSATADDGTCVQAGGTVTCELGTIDPTGSETVTITVRATGTVSPIVNEAEATSALDDPAGDSDTASTRVVPDLEIVKLDRPDPVDTGELLLYTIRVTNVGRSDASDVVVTDILNFDNVDFVEIDSADFECQRNADRIRCTGGVIPSDEDSTIELLVRPRQEGTLENIATAGVPGFTIDEATTTTVVGGGGTTDDVTTDDGTTDDGTTDDGTTDGTTTGTTDDGTTTGTTDNGTTTGTTDGGTDGDPVDGPQGDVVDEIVTEDLPDTGGFAVASRVMVLSAVLLGVAVMTPLAVKGRRRRD